MLKAKLIAKELAALTKDEELEQLRVEVKRLREELTGQEQISKEWQTMWENVSQSFHDAKQKQWEAEEEVRRLRWALECIKMIGPEDRAEYCDACWEAKDFAEKALEEPTVLADDAKESV